MPSIHLNRNLANYPLARDSRFGVTWRQSKKTGRWFCKLTSSVTLWLPSDAERRVPDGFDLNVLCFLLTDARMQKSRRLTIPSLAHIVKALGLGYDSANLIRVHRSLLLWSSLCIQMDQWYVPRRGDVPGSCGKRVRKRLPPPIQSLDEDGRSVEITINDEWRELGDRYWVSVPLPLPSKAVVQNLVLAIRTSAQRSDLSSSDSKYYHWRRTRKLCEAVGIERSDRRCRLRSAFEEADKWFGKRGWLLGHLENEGRIGFYLFEKPKEVKAVAKPRRRRERVRLSRLKSAAISKPDDDDDDETFTGISRDAGDDDYWNS